MQSFIRIVWFSTTVLTFIKLTDAVCERSARILAAEDICWTSKGKFSDRVQYTTKSVFNFAKEKLGIGTIEEKESYHPQQCDYYECIFGELKMLNADGYPNYDEITEWIDNNVIYNQAKALYHRLTRCHTALSKCVETNSYFYGDLTPNQTEISELQGNCEVLKEFMKCLSMEETDCIIFKYP